MSDRMGVSMSNKQPDWGELLSARLPTMLLKLFVFAALAFVLYEATVVHGSPALSASWTWVIIADMGCMLLLLAVDRLTELQVTPRGLEARLTEVQSQALEEVSAMEDPQVAQAARRQILQAKSAEQVKDAVAMAIELNVIQVVDRVQEAIRQKRRVIVRYRPDAEGTIQTYEVAPLDIKPGETGTTRTNDYLWVYSFEHGHILSLRLERVLSAEISEEAFAPDEILADWQEREWNVPREW
jgi:predicted DNA-binding transcriptional regulator YafY